MAPRTPIIKQLSKARAAAQQAARSSKGKDLLMYLLFVLVAFIFWILLSLDSEVTKDYDIPVEVTAVPDSVHLIGSVPTSINVTVRSKGSQLIRYEWGGGMPTLHLRFSDYSRKRSKFSVTRIRLDAALRDYFGAGVVVNAMKPDSISVPFTTKAGVKVPLRVLADIHTDLQYTISGPITASADSVELFSLDDLPHSLTSVDTEPIVRSGLTDTTRIEVMIKPMAHVKIVPPSVTVTIPVEPLIAKHRQVPIEVTGLPGGTSLITFPSKASLSYLVPMSAYNSDYPLKVYVDYADIANRHTSGTGKIALRIASVPPAYTGLTFSPDSVEYIIEQRHFK